MYKTQISTGPINHNVKYDMYMDIRIKGRGDHVMDSLVLSDAYPFQRQIPAGLSTKIRVYANDDQLSRIVVHLLDKVVF